MDGLKLAHFVRDRWPPVKIVATSGRARIAESDLPEGGRFVPKPYSAAEITATLRELQQSKASSSVSGTGRPRPLVASYENRSGPVGGWSGIGQTENSGWF